MNNQTYKKLNSTETITNALPRLIEAFTTFYGETEREKITEKFNNILIIGYANPEQVRHILREDKKQKSNELIEVLLSKLKISKEDYEKYNKIYFDKNELDYPNLHPIYNYVQYTNGNKSEYHKNKVYEFLKQLYPTITIEDLDKSIPSEIKKDLNNILELYKEALTEYDKYLETLKEQEKYLERCNELKESLKRKYTKELISEFKYLFTEEEFRQIQEKIKSGFSVRFANKKGENYFGYNLNSTTYIDSFSIDSEEILKGNQEWRKESILKDRVKFFKNLGIDLGDNYNDYLNNQDIQKLIPSLKDLAEKIIHKRNEFYTRMMNEYYTSLEEYKTNCERIEKEGLLDKEHGYNANAYERNGTFVTTNVKQTENGMIMYPMLCLSIGGLSEYLDHFLIHELNHVYELTLGKIEGNKYYATCGWDILDGEYDNTAPDIVSIEENKNKREYELFNEIINELISQEITQILFESNGYIFNTKEDAKIKGGTSYENTMFLIKEFYNTYKKEIIESRRTGDMTELFNAVGKENFEALNKLFHEFYESFPGMSFYSVIQSINKKEETEQTKKFYELVEKRNKVLKSMEEHNQNKNHTL